MQISSFHCRRLVNVAQSSIVPGDVDYVSFLKDARNKSDIGRLCAEGMLGRWLTSIGELTWLHCGVRQERKSASKSGTSNAGRRAKPAPSAGRRSTWRRWRQDPIRSCCKCRLKCLKRTRLRILFKRGQCGGPVCEPCFWNDTALIL
jgi:hypothetical protein